MGSSEQTQILLKRKAKHDFDVNHSLLYMWIAVAWMYSLISSGLSDSQILRMAFVA